MMDDNLVIELQTKTNQLDACIKRLRQSGTEYASAERDVR